MMKKFIITAFLSTLFFGCSQPTPPKRPLAIINNYEITAEEFEEEFKNSPYAINPTFDTRKEFLDQLIIRKLILQDAQKKGLDKDKEFLKMIERFWEQSLLKLVLDKKSKEIAGSISVTDKAIQEIYQKMVAEGKTDKPYEQMYHQIKWEITQAKEAQAINNWLEDLRKQAKIQINYELIKQQK